MSTDSLLGRVVDSRYEIRSRVARGGMATVYLAHDNRLDRAVALKVMHAHLADSPDFVARFRREARAAARLSTPGAVAVYDQGTIDGVAYLVMEYIDGPHLRDLINAGPLAVKEALGLIAQVLRPLAAAHRAGLIHRDIKPENVLLPLDGSAAKVADFGLARAMTESTQTSTGNILGTVAYLAPELITKGTALPQADIYAVGIMLHELLTGRLPLMADTPINIAYRNVHEDVPTPSTLFPGLDPSIDDLVARMTARDLNHRLATADDALTALRSTVETLREEQLTARRDHSPAEIRSQRELVALALQARAGLSPEAIAEEGGSRTVSFPIGSIGPQGTQTIAAPTPSPSLPTTQLGSEKTSRMSRRVVLGSAAAVVLLGGASAGGWYFFVGPGRRVPVPEIAGMSAEQARAAIQAAELVWGEERTEYSDDVPSGSVITSSPAPGSRARVGSAVTVTISAGIEQKLVPNVSGMSVNEARAALQDAGLDLGEQTQEYHDSVPNGQVIDSTPAAGASVNHDSAVAVRVSRGREPVTVPDVTNQTREEATAALGGVGLRISETTEEYSDSVEQGRVISTAPSASTTGVYRGDQVTIVVSRGPEMVEVPHVVSMQEAQAIAALEAAGLQVSVNRVLGGFFGTARSTDPAAGTQVRKGSTVTLSVV